MADKMLTSLCNTLKCEEIQGRCRLIIRTIHTASEMKRNDGIGMLCTQLGLASLKLCKKYSTVLNPVEVLMDFRILELFGTSQ